MPLPTDRDPADPNDNAAAHAADHNEVHALINLINEGGTTGQVLGKTAGSVEAWIDAVSLSNAAPVALGTATPGTGVTASRTDHVHPLPTSLSLPGTPVIVGDATDTVGNIYNATSRESGVAIPLNQLHLYPIYLTRSATLKIGTAITTAAVGASDLRIAVYNDNGKDRAGTLAFDSGALNTQAQNFFLFSTATFAFVAFTRYWVGTVSQGAPTSPPTIGVQDRIAVKVPSWNAAESCASLRYDGITGALPDLTAVNPATSANNLPVIKFQR